MTATAALNTAPPQQLAEASLTRAFAELRAHGVAVIPDVLAAEAALEVRAALLDAAAESERRGMATFMPALDPNASNIRVFNLLDMHPVFRELITHPLALALMRGMLGEHISISNFTANIALPGSRSMSLHSDQALGSPEPWLAPWSGNVIWCLDDVTFENGGTFRCRRPACERR